MKVKVIRSFTDKNSLKSIPKDAELEITEKRFSELTAGPLGIFVEKIPANSENGKPDTSGEETPDASGDEKENKTTESPKNGKKPKKKRATRKTTKK